MQDIAYMCKVPVLILTPKIRNCLLVQLTIEIKRITLLLVAPVDLFFELPWGGNEQGVVSAAVHTDIMHYMYLSSRGLPDAKLQFDVN